MNLFKSVAKILLIGWVAYFVISSDFYEVLQTSEMSLGSSLKLVTWTAFKLIVIVSVILLILAIPDYIYQRYEFIESIKMSREELKQELKETEGNAFIKQKQRERGREIARNNMLREVPKASVVITNPTHYAVAIKYDEVFSPNPVLIAKGKDALARRIREIAIEAGVEIKENPPLARTLYQSVEVGDEIPAQFFEVLVKVFTTLKKFSRVR